MVIRDITTVEMQDILEAEVVEIVTSSDGRIWVNVDGICVARIKKSKKLVINMPADSFVKEAKNERAPDPADGGRPH